MIRSISFFSAVVCALVLSVHAEAAHVDLSLDLTFNTPNDISSGGIWTAVVKADESGLAGISFLVEGSNFDASPIGLSGFNVFETQGIGMVIEVVNGTDLINPILDVGVVGGTFADIYTEPAGIAPLAGQLDLGSFNGGAAIVVGTFPAGNVPNLIEMDGTRNQGANVFNDTGDAIAATMSTTVRGVVPEPASLALLGMALVGIATTTRRRS